MNRNSTVGLGICRACNHKHFFNGSGVCFKMSEDRKIICYCRKEIFNNLEYLEYMNEKKSKV